MKILMIILNIGLQLHHVNKYFMKNVLINQLRLHNKIDTVQFVLDIITYFFQIC